MKHKHRAIFLALAAMLLLLTAGAVVLAQTSAGFNLEWNVVGSGGGETSSASYHLNGTVGQGLASPPTSGSASFKVSSGYWFAGTGTGTTVFVPALLKN